MRKEWETAHTVTEETADGPPSQRANATLTPCPNGNHLWCIGGEYFSDDGKAVCNSYRSNTSLMDLSSISTMMCTGTRPTRYASSDITVLALYNGTQDEWRKFASPTCPGPRSAHAVVATPAGGGKLFLFGTTRSFPNSFSDCFQVANSLLSTKTHFITTEIFGAGGPHSSLT